MPHSDLDALSLLAAIRSALQLAEAQGHTLVAAKLADAMDSVTSRRAPDSGAL